MTLKFETGVPIPKGKATGVSALLRELAAKPTGTSVVFTGDEDSTLRSLMTRITKDTGVKFVSRKVEGGRRVWRIA